MWLRKDTVSVQKCEWLKVIGTKCPAGSNVRERKKKTSQLRPRFCVLQLFQWWAFAAYQFDTNCVLLTGRNCMSDRPKKSQKANSLIYKKPCHYLLEPICLCVTACFFLCHSQLKTDDLISAYLRPFIVKSGSLTAITQLWLTLDHQCACEKAIVSQQFHHSFEHLAHASWLLILDATPVLSWQWKRLRTCLLIIYQLYLVFTSLLVSSVCVRAVLLGSLQSGEEATVSSSLFDELMMVFVVSSCFSGEIYRVNKMLCYLILSCMKSNWNTF